MPHQSILIFAVLSICFLASLDAAAVLKSSSRAGTCPKSEKCLIFHFKRASLNTAGYSVEVIRWIQQLFEMLTPHTPATESISSQFTSTLHDDSCKYP